MRQTFIGSGTPRSTGGTEHTTRPNLMANFTVRNRLTEKTRLGLQADLRALLGRAEVENSHLIEDITINVGGDIYLDLHPCTQEERALAINAYLVALEALELHDREQGVENYAV